MTNQSNSQNFTNIEDLTGLDKANLKKMVEELSDSLAREHAEKTYRKEAIGDICHKLNINPKVLKKMAEVYHKGNIIETAEGYRRFVYAYKSLMGFKEEGDDEQDSAGIP